MALLIALLIALSQTFGWTPAPAAMTPAVETFGPGTWLVPEDIKPGTYRGLGDARPGYHCYWARLSGLGGELSDVIANSGSQSGPIIVTIKKTDSAFTSHSCGDWKRVKRS